MSGGETLSGGTVSVPVKPDGKGFAAKLGESIAGESGGLREIGSRMGETLMKGLEFAGIAVGVGEFVKKGIEEYSTADALNAQFAAGIKSTGNAANLSVKGMDDLAKSIAGYSGQSYDSIGKTEQVLQTFTNLKNVGPNKIFDDATTAAANMAAKLGGDASASAIQLGKALNDPVKGMTALRRVGVSFTADQQAQVKAMVASGDVMGAQKVILGELNTEFGGAAKAAGETLPGEIARSKVAFGELTKAVMTGVMPFVTPVIAGIADAMNKATPFIEAFAEKFKGALEPAVEKSKEAFKQFVEGFKGGTDEVGSSQSIFAKLGDGLYWIFQSVKPVIKAVMDALKNLEPVFAPLIPQVLKLASSFSPFGLILHAILPVLPQIVAAVGPLVAQLGGALAQALGILLPVMSSLVKILVGELAGIFKILVPLIVNLAQALGPILGQILKALIPVIQIVAAFIGQAMKVIEPLIPVVMKLVAAVVPLLPPLLQLVSAILVPLINLFAQLLKPILNLVMALVTMLMPILIVVINFLAAVLPAAIKFLMPIIASVASIFGDVLGPAIRGVTQILGGVIDFITGVFTGNWSKAWKGVTEIFSGIWNTITGIVKGVVNGIIDLIDGVIKGVNSIGGAVGIHVGLIPHLAEGATVLPTPGGTVVRVAEGGKAESVVDTGKLNKLIDQATNGGGKSSGGNTYNIYEAISAQATAMQVARRQAARGAYPPPARATPHPRPEPQEVTMGQFVPDYAGGFVDGPAGNTPITQTVMNNIETNEAAEDVRNPGSEAAQVLAVLYGKDVRAWAPGTTYAAGQAVINPTGDIVTAKTAHVSGSTYNPANWNLASAFVPKTSQPLNVLNYGAVADNSTDNTAAFVAAAADAVAQHRSVFAPGGGYSFTAPGTGFIIPLTTGITLLGAGKGVTTFRIADAAGGLGWTAFIGSGTLDGVVDLSGLTLAGFTFDHNAAGNPMPSGVAASSVVRALVQVPKGSGISITNIDSINADGKWVVELGTTDATKASTQRVSDSYVDINVRNFGAGSVYHDSSAVYFYGDRNKVRGSYIAAANAPGAICAIEAHGDNSDVQVTVDGFMSIVNATGCDATTNHGVNIHDCIGRNLMIGVAIWSVNLVGATGYGVNGLTITNNYIDINPDYWSGTGKASPPGNFAHFGIGISDRGAASNLPMQNVAITGNTIVYQPATQSVQKTLDAGISMIRAAAMSGTPAPDMNINISGNHIDSPISAGVVVDLNNLAYNVHVDDNDVRNPAQMGTATIGAQYGAGVVVKGNFRLCTADRTRVLDDRVTAVANTAVDMSGVALTSSSARVQAMDPVIWAATTKPPVIGPSGGSGGVTMRASSHGYIAATGNFTYGSRYTDYANGHDYIQTAAPFGNAWNLWNEVRPEGVALGAPSVPVAQPTGMPYISSLAAAGPPTGAPTARPGLTPIVVDTAGKIWVYVALTSSWKGIATA